MQHIIVITTCAGEAEAAGLATALLERQLAACVQSSNIVSTYRWQGSIETAREIRLMIKARQADYEAIEALILELHSYDTPEVLAMAVTAGSAGYLGWIDSETRR